MKYSCTLDSPCTVKWELQESALSVCFFHELLVRGGLSFYGIIIIQRREGEKLGTTKSKFHEGRFSCVHSPPRRVEFEVCTTALGLCWKLMIFHQDGSQVICLSVSRERRCVVKKAFDHFIPKTLLGQAIKHTHESISGETSSFLLLSSGRVA